MKNSKRIFISIIAIILVASVAFFIKFFGLIAIVFFEDMKQPSPKDIKEHVIENHKNIINVISEIDTLKTEHEHYGFYARISGIGHTDKTTYIDNVKGLYIVIDDPSLGRYYKEISSIRLGNILKETFITNIEVLENGLSFDCGGKGIGSATSYYGFFFSNNDSPDLLKGCEYPKDEVLAQKGNGYIWKESDGDNYFYTEKIIDNFYYYETHY